MTVSPTVVKRTLGDTAPALLLERRSSMMECLPADECISLNAFVIDTHANGSLI